ncbi:acyltransferase [Undibacterium squillarum]|uniref:Acyltransferase n=1 Tax=Undibacterium squillarum TaxID=1131567 RepID=A0ABQ2XXP2_9BURK|nr:acyltransferase [Undibacterium squillarum]GGX36498.1 hypothetical protein GCM10010946_12880 [Undibacterium squillarum]
MKTVFSYLLYPLLQLGNLLERVRNLWAYSYCRFHFPAGFDASNVILGTPELHGTHRVYFGRNAYLYPQLYLETRQDAEIHIGDDVVISRGVHLVAYSAVHIGSGSMIGEYTSIRDANHQFGPGIAPRGSGVRSQPVRIGKCVWIGRGAVILPGVEIGDYAVVGANSVVTGNVLSGTVVAGAPARNVLTRRE